MPILPLPCLFVALVICLLIIIIVIIVIIVMLRFVREDSAAMSYSCLSSCVYERDDQPGTAFCFAQGDQQVVCGDSTPGTGSCKCGIKKTSRVVGGTETEVNEYPWIAAFDFSGTSGTSPGGCAATLVANNWAVTASHCFYNTEGVLTV